MTAKLRKLIKLLANTGKYFLDTNSFEKGASLSYYTVFALPPVLIIIITGAGMLFGREAVSGQVYSQLREVVGSEGALEIQQMVQKLRENTFTGLTALIGVVTFLVAATGAFVSMQDSLNNIWCVKAKPRNQFLKILTDRALSFVLILGITLLLLVSLATNALLVALGPYLEYVFSGRFVYYMLHVGNLVLMLIVISLLFASIYKFLPDATIGWRDVWVGGFVTAVLFSIGRSLIGLYLGTSNLASLYGAAGTVVLILVWVFYSSQILFFGAAFTHEYAKMEGRDIFPTQYAVRVVRQEVELGKTAVTQDPIPAADPKATSLHDPYSCDDPDPEHHRLHSSTEGGKPL